MADRNEKREPAANPMQRCQCHPDVCADPIESRSLDWSSAFALVPSPRLRCWPRARRPVSRPGPMLWGHSTNPTPRSERVWAAGMCSRAWYERQPGANPSPERGSSSGWRDPAANTTTTTGPRSSPILQGCIGLRATFHQGMAAVPLISMCALQRSGTRPWSRSITRVRIRPMARSILCSSL